MRIISAGLMLALLFSSMIYAEASGDNSSDEHFPADKIDLRFWKLTLPLDDNNDGKVDEVNVRSLKEYSHPDFFSLDENGLLVFTAPNKATTSANSTNTRSELRQMLRGKNTKFGTHHPKNNFSLKAHRGSKYFALVGGQLEATLKVLHVAKNAKHGNKKPAYSVVVGQIHADKDKEVINKGKGFGWGNEPIKVYYKKWPQHKTGSVFWTYERNLAKDNPDRTDIAYSVWGNTWENLQDPGKEGIALGELFNYNINVHGNTMYLTFRTSDPSKMVKYQIDLSNNVDAYGKVDEKDNPLGYSGDALYFKAGAYNQCSTKDDPAFWYAACAGTGDWKVDKANGDYTSVAFSRIQLAGPYDPDNTP
ncbi:MAG: polysaccharide lyase family 7 protein [Kangiellaceae bacterium]|nr:polysaccharide lyase family 7 protein [Kangiellaceae bacterium]